MKFRILSLVLLLVSSCASKKEILYMQDVDNFNGSTVSYSSPLIQPNDILKITIESQVQEAAMPYNKASQFGSQLTSLELLQLEGYLVTEDLTVSLPVLGEVSVSEKTPRSLQNHIKEILVTQGHLLDPTVNVRLLNAKFTVLGEVNQPGTYNFTEKSISLLQALGYARDLTINGKRDDVLLIRLDDNKQNISHIDLTSAEVLKSENYFIKPNDVIVVQPNNTKVKSAGFIGNASVVLTIASLALSSIILLTR